MSLGEQKTKNTYWVTSSPKSTYDFRDEVKRAIDMNLRTGILFLLENEV